ncbi:MAG: TIGR00730 family Rossman fold protein [Planctomycetaceae bacterium]|nr:TIGR00730 family Rossman fold protein [Planctomycetaceae bacterium]
MKSICVFCGSRLGSKPIYRETAKSVGQLIAQQQLRLVYGGGNIGLMGVVADAVLEYGGEVVGVIPGHLQEKEVGHAGLTELHVVSSMHERKALMANLSDAFIALPGGFGTFEEFCEILTWAQLDLHRKPCGLLNVDGFYDPLLTLFDRAVDDGFLRPEYRSMVLTATDADELLMRMRAYKIDPHFPPLRKEGTELI